MAKKVLHLIDTLGVGGAETLLLATLNGLENYDSNILVYLSAPDTLKKEFKNKVICLNYKKNNIFSFFKSVSRLRKLIKDEKIELVHAHLFWPTIMARLACPREVTLLFSVHNRLSEDAFKRNRLSQLLEYLTYKPFHSAIFVSEDSKNDYQRYIGIRGEYRILHNFIPDTFFEESYRKQVFSPDTLRLVAVGTLKEQKNYTFLVACFKDLQNMGISLDIYGEGEQRGILEGMMVQHQIQNIQLKGNQNNLYTILKQYDLFVMASKYEGFGIAAAEAMAVGLPCLFSDIPVFREITDNKAVFFKLDSTRDFVFKVKELKKNIKVLQNLSSESTAQAKAFGKEAYLKKLNTLYGN